MNDFENDIVPGSMMDARAQIKVAEKQRRGRKRKSANPNVCYVSMAVPVALNDRIMQHAYDNNVSVSSLLKDITYKYFNQIDAQKTGIEHAEWTTKLRHDLQPFLDIYDVAFGHMALHDWENCIKNDPNIIKGSMMDARVQWLSVKEINKFLRRIYDAITGVRNINGHTFNITAFRCRDVRHASKFLHWDRDASKFILEKDYFPSSYYASQRPSFDAHDWERELIAQLQPFTHIKDLGIRASCIVEWAKAYRGAGQPTRRKWTTTLKNMRFKVENKSINNAAVRCYFINATRAADIKTFLEYDNDMWVLK